MQRRPGPGIITQADDSRAWQLPMEYLYQTAPEEEEHLRATQVPQPPLVYLLAIPRMKFVLGTLSMYSS